MLEENCNLAEDRISCLEGELRDVTLIADESALKFDEVAHFRHIFSPTTIFAHEK